MTVVTVTGNVNDFAGVVIPAGVVPELWFRPNKPIVSGSRLMPDVEIKATLNTITGAFTVPLDNDSRARYTPVLRWLLNPAEAVPERRSWGRAEWRDFWFHPGMGGQLDTMIDVDFGSFIAFYFGALSDPPPEGFRGYWEVQAEPGREDSEDPFIGDVRKVYGG